MNKELNILMEIRNVIDRHKNDTDFYKDSEVIDGIDLLINEYFIERAQTHSSWKICRDEQFKKDLETCSISKMSMKYGVSYQAIHYHKTKLSKK